MYITGETGFIGSALKAELDKQQVSDDYFFAFGSPSSGILFNEDYHCIKETINGFIEVCEFCKRHRLKLIFPSSATVYDNKLPYARTKSALEDIVEAYQIDYLALRIFAGYGPGEGHKKDYASVVYQFYQAMKNGISPVIYGDGTQTRDFVYIDDIVKLILKYYSSHHGVMDIGTGVSTSFNQLIAMINELLGTETAPIYVKKPNIYVEETVCNAPIASFTSVTEGLRQMHKKLH